MHSRSRFNFAAFTGLNLLVLALAVVSAQAQVKTRLSIATGGTGGVYYPLGGGLAAFMSKYLPGVEATAEVTTASMIKLAVPAYAAHMVIFYYAVLSGVSPPTALSPLPPRRSPGGDPYKTTMMAWKYTLPAFLVPFMFTLHPDGIGLLLKGSWGNIAWTTITAAVGLAALAAGLTGWLLMKTTWFERGLLVAAGLVLVYPSLLEDLIGLTLFAVAAALQYLHRRSAAGRLSAAN